MTTCHTDLQLTTDRLHLRPLAPGDEDRLFEMNSNADFMRYGSSLPWTSIDQAVARIDSDRRDMAAGTHVWLGIFLRDTRRLVGTCSLFNLDRQFRRAEVGYGIAPECWRQGFMAEAVSALLEFAFSELDLHRIEADVDPRNEASGRALEKLGFQREGLLRERWLIGGDVSDAVFYGLLRRDWEARRQSVVPGDQ